jgi:hypothetical protein
MVAPVLEPNDARVTRCGAEENEREENKNGGKKIL